MAWPTTPISTTNLLDGTKNPSLARADLLLLAEAVNDIIAARGAAGGIASIGSDGTLASSQLDPAGVLAAVVSVSGEGSLLDADLLDGIQGSAYATLDGLRQFISSGSNAHIIRHSGSATSSIYETLRIYHDTSGTPVAGFGVALGFRGTAAGGEGKLGDVAFSWTDPNVLSADSKVALRTINAGALEDALVCNAGYLELRQISSPAGDAAAGRTWIYSKSDGLYVKRSGVAETLLGAGGGGVTDHGALTGLADDDHTQYLLTTGARALTGTISFATFPPSYDQLAGDPSAPGSGKWRLYFKSGGAYIITGTGAGTVTGPLGAGGASDHGALTGLADDDHTQYLLRQPAANYVLNDAGSDYDFRVEGVSTPNLFNLDAGDAQVTINGTAASNSSCRFAAIGSSGGAIYGQANGGPCFKAGPSTAGSTGLLATTTHASATGAKITTATDSRAVYLVEISDTSATIGSSTMVMLKATNATTETLLDSRRNIGGVDNSIFAVTGWGAQVNGGSKDELFFIVKANSSMGLGAEDLLHCTSVDNQVGVGLTPAAATARLQVKADTDIPLAAKITAVTTQAGLLAVTSSGTSIEAQATTGQALKSGVTATAGTAAYLYRTVASSGGGAILKAEITHASDNGVVAELKTAGTGALLNCLVGAAAQFTVGNGGELTGKERSAPSAPASTYRTIWPQATTGWWTRGSSGNPQNVVAVEPGANNGFTIYHNGTTFAANDRWLYTETLASSTYTTKNEMSAYNGASQTGITFGPQLVCKSVSVSGASTSVFTVGPGLVVGAYCHVTTGVTGATRFHLGTSADPILMLADVEADVGVKSTPSDFRPRPCLYLPTATALVLTSADAAFSGGVVHVSVHLISSAYA